ncbi:hypothetical protein QBC47DRAFT_40104 [Echria macrotheca]|uniref:Uncharacterized protein n=1 Tax=Echria macrotheca TaxID=438768 RepID=A0AAJ0F458_9PEZI|nr:hypothetical protein QBC47DRAFT_40104 [Echria macrotheca]
MLSGQPLPKNPNRDFFLSAVYYRFIVGGITLASVGRSARSVGRSPYIHPSSLLLVILGRRWADMWHSFDAWSGGGGGRGANPTQHPRVKLVAGLTKNRAPVIFSPRCGVFASFLLLVTFVIDLAPFLLRISIQRVKDGFATLTRPQLSCRVEKGECIAIRETGECAIL